MEYTSLKVLSDDFLSGKITEKEFVNEHNKMIEKENEKRIDKSFEPHEHI